MEEKNKVLTECIVNGNRLAIIVIDEEKKEAAEAVWNGEFWETDFSYPSLGVTINEVAEAMNYDAVKEAGYTIVE
ncbi:MAG TPA: hypothetical protein GX708_01870 [Gallicola sp.]|nr:hypothetical protein [Gallicola sp.]